MVVLVDTEDNAIGTMEKMEAHYKGVLHRAFSVLLFNSEGKMLIQKRASQKYHSAGLWTNTCCSHPLPGEKIEIAARRRLNEEMGIDVVPKFAFKFIYKASLDQQLIEHEYDHVFVGTYNGAPMINRNEVDDWKYVELTWLKKDMALNPQAYTFWFKLIMNDPQLAAASQIR